MKSKTFFRVSVMFICVVLIGITTVQIMIDPCFQYHRPILGMKPLLKNERYQNPGVAKNFEFDNVIIGNSMCENFRASWFTEYFGGKTVKLTSAGSHALDWTYLLSIISEKDDMPKNIVMNFDMGILNASTTQLKEPLPEYLYDNELINDVNYYLNFSVVKSLTIRYIVDNLKDKIPPEDDAYIWDDGTKCGKEKVLEAYSIEQTQNNNDNVKNREEMVDLARANIDLLEPYIEQLVDTKFIFFVSPFSLLYWERASLYPSELLSINEQMYTAAIGDLLEHPNVEIFFWDDDEMLEKMSNLDNYRDTTHYSIEISKIISDRIGREYGKLSTKNYKERIEAFFSLLRHYNYDELKY